MALGTTAIGARTPSSRSRVSIARVGTTTASAALA
jgi:hypothetical protein